MRKERKQTIRTQRLNFDTFDGAKPRPSGRGSKAPLSINPERSRRVDFISRISHALRTPLCITREGISLVLDRIPGQLNRKQEEILITARDNIDRLNRTLCKLLKAYKIGPEKERKMKRLGRRRNGR